MLPAATLAQLPAAMGGAADGAADGECMPAGLGGAGWRCMGAGVLGCAALQARLPGSKPVLLAGPPAAMGGSK